MKTRTSPRNHPRPLPATPIGDTIRISGFDTCDDLPLESLSIRRLAYSAISFHGVARDDSRRFSLLLDSIGARAIHYDLSTAYHSKPQMEESPAIAHNPTMSVRWDGRPLPDSKWSVAEISIEARFRNSLLMTIRTDSGPIIHLWFPRKYAAFLLGELDEILRRV